MLLEVDGIDAFYREAQALFEVSLKVDEGEVVALVGSNGAGKSTTLKVASGLLPARRGEVRFRGSRISGGSPSSLLDRGIAHIPEGRAVFSQLSVRDNLIAGSYIRRSWKSRRAALKRAFDLFPRLAERQHQVAGSLSGGEQRMLAIGRALATEPGVLLVDEPTLGLAPVIIDGLFEVLRSLNEAGSTILIVEQNIRALDIAHRAYVIEAGRIVYTGKANDLRDDERLRASYLGVAPTIESGVQK